MALRETLREASFMFITDRHRTLDRGTLEVVRAALKGGVRWIQYREPDLNDEDFYVECLKVKELCDAVGAGLIINDRLDVAELVRANGVHLGKGGLPVRVVKQYMGESFHVGYSAHSKEEATTREWEGVSYITYSPIFPLAHKSSPHEPHGVDGAKEILESIKLPVFMLGGINLENLSELAGSVSMLRVAATSMISEADDVTSTAEKVIEILKSRIK